MPSCQNFQFHYIVTRYILAYSFFKFVNIVSGTKELDFCHLHYIFSLFSVSNLPTIWALSSACCLCAAAPVLPTTLHPWLLELLAFSSAWLPTFFIIEQLTHLIGHHVDSCPLGREGKEKEHGKESDYVWF